MDILTYQIEASATKSDKFYPPSEWKFNVKGIEVTFPNSDSIDVCHSIIGLSTEGSELLDVVKKAMFYGKPVDITNLEEEMGDMLWYIATYCNATGNTFEKIAAQNSEKLKARFPEKFTEFHANNRDLVNERNILESHS